MAFFRKTCRFCGENHTLRKFVSLCPHCQTAYPRFNSALLANGLYYRNVVPGVALLAGIAVYILAYRLDEAKDTLSFFQEIFSKPEP